MLTFWDKVETDTTDVLLGTEILQIIHLVALDFEFQQTKILQTHLVAHTEMTPDSISHIHHQTLEYPSAQTSPSCCLLIKLMTLYQLIMNSLSLILPIRRQLRLIYKACQSFPSECYRRWNKTMGLTEEEVVPKIDRKFMKSVFSPKNIWKIQILFVPLQICLNTI